MTEPHVSIIVPVYNVALYIEDCLRSVAEQTMTEGVECILVDDGGTDNSVAIAEDFIKYYSDNIQFLILHHEENKGISAARNTGFSAATGDYVIFLDSDDEILPHAIETLYDKTKDMPYDIVMGDVMLSGIKNRRSTLRIPDATVFMNSDILAASNNSQIYAMPVNKLVRRSFLLEKGLRFKEGVITEDDLWSFETYSSARSLYVSREVTYNYKCREGSTITFSSLQRYIDSKKIILEEAKTFIVQQGMRKDPEALKWYNTSVKVYLEFCRHQSEELEKSEYIRIHESIPFSKSFVMGCVMRNPRRFLSSLHFALPLFCSRLFTHLIQLAGCVLPRPTNVIGQ